MHLVPPERPRWKSPQLRLFTKSQHSKRASSPKVTLGPCCSMFVSATLSPFKKMSPQAGRAIKARTDGARRRRMARQVEWEVGMCKIPSRMPITKQASSDGGYNCYDSFANVPPQSAPTHCTWATGSKHPTHSRVWPSRFHHRQGKRALFRRAGLLRREKICWSLKS